MSEAADQCGVSIRTVQRWLASGELPAVFFGKRTVRINSAAVRALIAKKTRVLLPVQPVSSPSAVIPVKPPCAAQRLAKIIRLPVKTPRR